MIMKKFSATITVFLFLYIGMSMTNVLALNQVVPMPQQPSESLDDYWSWSPDGPYPPPYNDHKSPPPAGQNPPPARQYPPPSYGYDFNPIQCAALFADGGVCVAQFYANEFDKGHCCGIFQQLADQCPGGRDVPHALPRDTCR